MSRKRGVKRRIRQAIESHGLGPQLEDGTISIRSYAQVDVASDDPALAEKVCIALGWRREPAAWGFMVCPK